MGEACSASVRTPYRTPLTLVNRFSHIRSGVARLPLPEEPFFFPKHQQIAPLGRTLLNV